MPEQIYTNEVNVRLDEGCGLPSIQSVIDACGAVLKEQTPQLNIYHFELPPSTLTEFIFTLDSMIEVVFAQRTTLHKNCSFYKPADELLYKQEAVFKEINAYEGWAITTGNSSVKIAVLDSGIDTTHPDLTPNIVASHDSTGLGVTDTFGHGTFIAGIIGAAKNNGVSGTGVVGAQGVVGIAPDCGLVPVRIAGNAFWMADEYAWVAGVLSNAAMSAAFIWAADNGCKVINYSFGSGKQAPSSFTITSSVGLDATFTIQSDQTAWAFCTVKQRLLFLSASGKAYGAITGSSDNGTTRTVTILMDVVPLSGVYVSVHAIDQNLDAAVTYAYNKGCIVTIAAGNSYESERNNYPAYESATHALMIAASDSATLGLNSYSDRGAWIDFVAPGDHFNTYTSYDRRYGIGSGAQTTAANNYTIAMHGHLTMGSNVITGFRTDFGAKPSDILGQILTPPYIYGTPSILPDGVKFIGYDNDAGTVTMSSSVAVLGSGYSLDGSEFTLHYSTSITYGGGTGTSYAAPMVAALAGLLWSKNPAWTKEQVITAMKATASPIVAVANTYGAGMVNVGAALQVEFSGVSNGKDVLGNSVSSSDLNGNVVTALRCDGTPL